MTLVLARHRFSSPANASPFALRSSHESLIYPTDAPLALSFVAWDGFDADAVITGRSHAADDQPVDGAGCRRPAGFGGPGTLLGLVPPADVLWTSLWLYGRVLGPQIHRTRDHDL